MKTTKQIRRQSKELYRLCLVNGTLDEVQSSSSCEDNRPVEAPRLSGAVGEVPAVGET